MDIKDLKHLLSAGREAINKLKGKAKALKLAEILSSVDDQEARSLLASELGSCLYSNDSYSTKTLPIIGGALFGITVVGLLFNPTPEGLLYMALRGLLALSLALIAVLLSGKATFEHKVGNAAVKAGGPIAVFLAIYYLNPAQLHVKNSIPKFEQNSASTNTTQQVDSPSKTNH
ncbi:MAG: hypothetical protein K9M54_04405 [Kiritimatiellales bacterium]|nr:hypothetical protein [Kiritimatiellales bacterium]